MRSFGQFVASSVAKGFLIAVPVYLAILLLLKALSTVKGLVRPLAALYPPALNTAASEYALALLAVTAICFAIGVFVRTPRGRAAEEYFERAILEKIPGYILVRNLTQQLAGKGRDNVWKPALAELEEGLVPVFIIEEIRDRYTVFVPSVPTPFMGSIYILRRERVHPVSTSFAQTFQALSRWGSGAGALVAEMEPAPDTSTGRTSAKVA